MRTDRTAPEPELPQPVSQGDAQPVSQGDVQPVSQGDAQPVSQGDAQPVSQGDAQPVSQGDAQPVSQGDAQPVSQGDAQPAASVLPALPAQPGGDSIQDPVPGPVSPSPANPVEEGVAVAGKRDLTGLVGASEVSVFADTDGQYVRSMAVQQTLEEDAAASQVSETTLLESIRAGRNFNRDSLAALARKEQANAQTGQALSLLLPSVTVRLSRGYETSEPSVEMDATGKPISSDTHMRTDIGFTARQPLFDLPSFLEWRRRKVLELARGENYRVSDGEAYLAAVSAYLALVSTRVQADMTRDFETQLAELLTYIEKRTSAGAASVSDMARVRARSQATLSSRLEQESAHAAAGIEFVRLTNIVPQKVRLPELADVGASLLPATFDEAVALAMQANPEIAALAAEVKAEKLDIAATKGRFLPRVDAEYTDSYSQHAGGDISEEGQRDRRSMLVLNWSPLSGGRDFKYHAERTARHKELKYRLDDQRRRIVQTLSANYATLATTRERIASGYQELESISTASEAMSKRMLSGNQSLLDLLDVYDRFYQVRSRLVSLHILELSTVAQLVRITLGAPGEAFNSAPSLASGSEAPPHTDKPLAQETP